MRIWEGRLIEQTRDRLKEWGRWASGGVPTVGSMFRALYGRGGEPHDEMPLPVQEIDLIVCRAQPRDRSTLIGFYSRSGTLSDKAREMAIPRGTLRRRLERAEWYVNSCLDGFAPFGVASEPRMRFFTAGET
jgi:hypothetical protein